ncbi:NAD(P)-binding domain-containing protein [Mycoplasmopsis agalactiae]|nr:NAD(P)H-dependent glycerol-3-phosphate dehydrogenase [Mycoplasmopsis agalactiae]MCE6056051.1 NAD(P)-binding domain-containing protein [Mycoplasmopsis agalactiae]MCE6091199.1 NAD(P)-binding domain-containing protein [Mycoplasmopsis agalactiae]
MSKKVTIIGTGAWASGLANVLSYNNHKITMWGIDNKEINDINNGINSKYFGDKKFNNPNNVHATDNLEEALNELDLMILAVPSGAIDSVLGQIRNILGTRKIKIVNVAKGIDSKTKKFFSDVLVEKFSDNIEHYCSILGPSFATEVFENALTMINIVGPNHCFLLEVSKTFNNKYFRLIINPNEKGSELFAALKNVLAIGIGAITHMFPYKNTESALLATGAKEIYQIYKALFNSADNNLPLELSAIGDIFLTCSSMKSRNFLFGTQIAQKGLKTVLEENTKTVEGYHNAKILEDILNDNKSISAPFLRSIIDVLYHNKDVKKLTDFIEEYN